MSRRLVPGETGYLVAAPGVTAYPLDDELVLYEPRSGEAYMVNATGARLWALCDGTRDANAVARELADAFGLPRERVAADVDELLAALQRARLLTTTPSGDRGPEEPA